MAVEIVMEVQKILTRVRRVEERITHDERLVRACKRAARLVSQSLVATV